MRYQKLPQKREIGELQFTIGHYNLQSKIKDLKSNSALLLLLWLMLFFFSNFLLLSCSDEEALLAKKEKEAETIKGKADYLWKLGKEIDSLKFYEQLVLKFPETSVKKSAEDQLLKAGISIGSPFVSWTSKRMFKMENTLVAYRDAKGAYPLGHGIKHPVDAWGNEIYFRLFPDKKIYDFIVYSMGPDKEKGTDDDILVIHNKDKEKDNNLNAKNTDRRLSFDELRKLSDNSEDSSEVSLSLDQLKGAIKNKSSNSGSEAQELTLDKLRNLAKDN